MPYLMGGPFYPTSDGTASSLSASNFSGGLQWTLPFLGRFSASLQYCTDSQIQVSTKFGGTPGESYDVTIRIQGVIEERTYVGGSKNGWFHTGGDPGALTDRSNIYGMYVSSPATQYYINSGTNGVPCQVLDYTVTIQIDAGATITMTAYSVSGDGSVSGMCLEADHTLSHPNVTDPAQPVAGQWAKLTVLGAIKR